MRDFKIGEKVYYLPAFTPNDNVERLQKVEITNLSYYKNNITGLERLRYVEFDNNEQVHLSRIYKSKEDFLKQKQMKIDKEINRIKEQIQDIKSLIVFAIDNELRCTNTIVEYDGYGDLHEDRNTDFIAWKERAKELGVI
ncbi:MAG: hypothetical protein LBV67_10565 [Streptococcaceae bacterium]|nr:hypothetical protein [Streptococcaceae bacterium]